MRNLRVCFPTWFDFSGDLLCVFVLCGPVCRELLLSTSWLSPNMKTSSHGTACCRNVQPFISHNLLHEPDHGGGQILSHHPYRGCAGKIPTRSLTPWPSILIASWHILEHTRWKPGHWIHPSLYSELLGFTP